MPKSTISDIEARNVKIAEGIKRGLEDIADGRVIPHEEAMVRIRAAIDRVKAEKRAARS